MTTPRDQETTKKTRSYKRTNDIINDYGDWLLIDISTTKFPNASMAVDTDVFVAHEGGRIRADSDGTNIYARYNIKFNSKQKPKKFHRDVIHIPEGLVCDHIHHYPYEFIDNRRCNLRAVTSSENGMNSALGSNNKSGVKGVSWDARDKRWKAGIRINRKRKHLGNYADINDAITARKQAEEKYFGEYAFGASK